MTARMNRMQWCSAAMGCAVLALAPADAIDRKEVLEQMRKSRPQDMTVLIDRPDAGGQLIVGIYGIRKVPSDPDLRRFQIWEESPADLNIYFESANCSKDAPVRVKRTGTSVYVRMLNPGGPVNDGNLEDHLVWWAACVPEFAGRDPATLREQALSLGFSTLIPERQEELPALAP